MERMKKKNAMTISCASRNRRRTMIVLIVITFCLVTVFFGLFGFKPKSPGLPNPEEEPFLRSPPEEKLPPSGGRHPEVVCLIMTTPPNHRDRARHVASTWGVKDDHKERKKGGERSYFESCPDAIFVTSAPHPEIRNTIYTSYSSYDEIWGKVLVAFKSVNASKTDWFMKADDDTFVIFPRLQKLLNRFDANQPLFLGHHLVYTFENGREIEYMSGGAGYLLSAPAVRMLQDTKLKECQYPGETSYEDVNMGQCMAALGVQFGDTRDPLGRAVFLPYPPQVFFDPDSILNPRFSWINSLSKYPIKFGTRHLSDRVVSFHEVRNPVDLYLLQYLTHHLHIHKPSEATPFVRL